MTEPLTKKEKKAILRYMEKLMMGDIHPGLDEAYPIYRKLYIDAYGENEWDELEQERIEAADE